MFKGFVKRSAGFLVPATLRIWPPPLAKKSCAKSALMLRCLVRGVTPVRVAIAFAALLSVCTFISTSRSLTSFMKLLMNIASANPMVKALSSASAELRANAA